MHNFIFHFLNGVDTFASKPNLPTEGKHINAYAYQCMAIYFMSDNSFHNILNFSNHGLETKQVACGASSASPPSLSHVKIVNGTKSKINDWPWAAALLESQKNYDISLNRNGKDVLVYFCSGAIVSKRYIITAGHCVVG